MRNKLIKYAGIFCLSLLYTACTVPAVVQKKENKNVPVGYKDSKDTINTAKIKWKDFFVDPYLTALIDTALRNNQELNIILQDIQIAQNEVRARKGAYLPFANIGGGVGFDKSGRYTRQGAVDATTEIEPGKPTPTTKASTRFRAWRRIATIFLLIYPAHQQCKPCAVSS